MVTQLDVQGWAGDLDDVLDRIGSRFGRAEPQRRAAAYLRGLLAPAVSGGENARLNVTPKYPHDRVESQEQQAIRKL